MTFQEAQARVDRWIGRFEEGYWPPLAILARLMEEVGELSREINHRFGSKPKRDDEAPAELELEIGDVLFVLVSLANQQGIDLSRAFERVMEKVEKRDRGRWTPKPTASGRAARARLPGEEEAVAAADKAVATAEEGVAEAEQEVQSRTDDPYGSLPPSDESRAVMAAERGVSEANQAAGRERKEERESISKEIETAAKAREDAAAEAEAANFAAVQKAEREQKKTRWKFEDAVDHQDFVGLNADWKGDPEGSKEQVIAASQAVEAARDAAIAADAALEDAKKGKSTPPKAKKQAEAKINRLKKKLDDVGKKPPKRQAAAEAKLKEARERVKPEADKALAESKKKLSAAKRKLVTAKKRQAAAKKKRDETKAETKPPPKSP